MKVIYIVKGIILGSYFYYIKMFGDVNFIM